jgi:excisionase family DNA binding protein
MDNSKIGMRVEEFAKLIDVNLIRAYEMARQPGFPSLRVGKRIVILRDQVEQWLMNETLKDKSQRK